MMARKWAYFDPHSLSALGLEIQEHGKMPDVVVHSWETEVWIADSPTHLIHFNGERFLGPYEE